MIVLVFSKMSNLYSKSKYGSCCVVPGCSMRSGTNLLSKIKAFTFPKDDSRRASWLQVIRRENFSLKKHSVICSKHFIEGRPSSDPDHPDYIPTVFPFKIKGSNKEVERKLSRFNRLKERRRVLENASSVQPTGDQEPFETMPEVSSTVQFKESGSNTDFAGYQFDELKSENAMLKQKIKDYEKIIKQMEEKQRSLATSYEKVKQQQKDHDLKERILKDEKLLYFYTGLQNTKLFNTLLSMLTSKYELDDPVLSHKLQFLMVLMRLRLGLLLTDLGHRFGIAASKACNVIHKWLGALYEICKCLILWPTKKCVRRNLPKVFKTPMFSDVRGIIDCFELYIQKPKKFNDRAVTYSSYKSHNTLKVLIVTLPSGGISFISSAFGGRSTDKEITSRSGLMGHVEQGDVYLVDRGFRCEDMFALKGAKILLPSFTKGKSQLSGKEVTISRMYSSVRIHVERRIGKLKKFRILQSVLPISSLKRPNDDGQSVCTIDKYLTICAALSNTQKPIIKKH